MDARRRRTIGRDRKKTGGQRYRWEKREASCGLDLFGDVVHDEQERIIHDAETAEYLRTARDTDVHDPFGRVTYPCIVFDRLHQLIVKERFEFQSGRVQMLEIVVFQRRHLPFSFFLRRLAFVDRPFEIVLLVQSDTCRHEIVHDHEANVLVRTLIAKHAEELRQQRHRILREVHVVAR